MSLKGKKRTITRTLLRASRARPSEIHDPDNFGCSPAIKATVARPLAWKKRTATYEHWLWPLFPRETWKPDARPATPRTWSSLSNDVGWTLSEGKDLYRQRGCALPSLRRLRQEPEDLLSIAQQIKQLDQEKKDNVKQASDLMKQADKARANEEANHLNERAVALKVTNSKLDLRIVQLDRSTKSLLEDMKKVGPNLKDIRLKLNKTWIPVWLRKPSDFRPTTKMPNFRLNEDQIKAISAYLWQSALTDSLPKHKPETPRTARSCSKRAAAWLPLHRRRRPECRAERLPQTSRASERKTITTISCAGSTTRASARVPIAPTRRRTSVPKDYKKKGLPYVFDLDQQPLPQRRPRTAIQNMTVMPRLRLSPQDAGDVASYLITLQRRALRRIPQRRSWTIPI